MVRIVQAASGALFAGFLVVHLLNTWLAAAGSGVGHVAAVRLIPGWFGIRPGFDGVAFSLAWLPGWFYPYYWMLGFGGVLFPIDDPWQSDFARLYLRFVDG